MTEKEAQAKQLDSVTDHVEEQEVDNAKAQQAMSALLTKDERHSGGADAGYIVSNEDVKLIVDELEVSDEVAEKTLREVASTLQEGESLVKAALLKLIMS